jgi:hypothetical protein
MPRGAKTERSSEKMTEEARNSITIDLGKLYQCRAEDIFPEITATAYSNLAYVNCTGRDVFIDFLEMPGVKCPDGTVRLRGTRVYMSHAAARPETGGSSGGGAEAERPEEEGSVIRRQPAPLTFRQSRSFRAAEPIRTDSRSGKPDPETVVPVPETIWACPDVVRWDAPEISRKNRPEEHPAHRPDLLKGTR